jgi:GAF domain-containing protein/anti-sigma regulatory factor (Ser/Thr protein kinase)
MRWPHRNTAVATVAAVLFLAVFGARWLTHDPSSALTALYALPVALIAAAFGLRAGIAAVCLAFAMTLMWNVGQDAGLGPVGLGSRLGAFLAAGATVGIVADQAARLRKERQRLQQQSIDSVHRERQADRMESLVAILSRAATPEQVATAFIDTGLPLLGAAQGGVFVLDHDDGPAVLRLVAVATPLHTEQDWVTVPLHLATPPTDAARTGTATFQGSVPEILAAYPELAATREASGDQAWAAAPLHGRNGVLGAVAAGYNTPRPFDADERELVLSIAQRVAEAIDRAQLLGIADAERRRAEVSERRASLLSDVVTALNAESGSAERMRALVERLVPAFADFASVERVAGSRLMLLAAADALPDRLPALRATRLQHDLDGGDAFGLVECVRTGQARRSQGADDGGGVSCLTLPLNVRGTVMAGLLLGRRAGRSAFTGADLSLAGMVAVRSALALDSALLFEQQRDVAATLQEALLPNRLPVAAGMSAAARYLPGTAALDVGGDWYDVLALPGGGIGVVLGDVVGRGVGAAATMGRLRSAVTAIAPYSAGPAQVLERLDAFADTVPGATLATVAYADFDPRTGLLRHACAGHPPPLLVDRRGARFLSGGRSAPLLAMRHLPRTQADVVIDGSATLICYSDGLVERRDADIDDRLALLLHTVAELMDQPIGALCDAVLKRLVGSASLEDDVALLCLRLEPLAHEGLHVVVPARPEQLAPLRARLREWAGRAQLDPISTDNLMLAVTEACANSIEHAYPPTGIGATVDVEVAPLLDGTVAVRVSDTGRWRDPVSDDRFRGRGLGVIRAATSEMTIDHEPSGTVVTMLLPPLGR